VWIVSNPIYVRDPMAGVDSELPQPMATASLNLGANAERWRVEASESSRADLRAATPSADPFALRFDYSLGEEPAGGQSAALVVETKGGVGSFERLRFRARADSPMRVLVQARVAVTPSRDEAWGQSVYLDSAERDVTIAFDEMKPLGETRTPVAPRAQIHSLVLAVTQINTKPGTAGGFSISGVELQR
jgi:hypothetical protein